MLLSRCACGPVTRRHVSCSCSFPCVSCFTCDKTPCLSIQMETSTLSEWDPGPTANGCHVRGESKHAKIKRQKIRERIIWSISDQRTSGKYLDSPQEVGFPPLRLYFSLLPLKRLFRKKYFFRYEICGGGSLKPRRSATRGTETIQLTILKNEQNPGTYAWFPTMHCG